MGIRNGSWGSDSGLFSFSNLNSNMSSPEQKSALCIIVDVFLCSQPSALCCASVSSTAPVDACGIVSDLNRFNSVAFEMLLYIWFVKTGKERQLIYIGDTFYI